MCGMQAQPPSLQLWLSATYCAYKVLPGLPAPTTPEAIVPVSLKHCFSDPWKPGPRVAAVQGASSLHLTEGGWGTGEHRLLP